jgi:hypothetical protein
LSVHAEYVAGISKYRHVSLAKYELKTTPVGGPVSWMRPMTFVRFEFRYFGNWMFWTLIIDATDELGAKHDTRKKATFGVDKSKEFCGTYCFHPADVSAETYASCPGPVNPIQSGIWAQLRAGATDTDKANVGSATWVIYNLSWRSTYTNAKFKRFGLFETYRGIDDATVVW